LPLLGALALTLAPGAARGQDQPALRTVVYGSGPGGAEPGGDRWQASLGLRTSLVRSAGFDPFSDGDALSHGSLVLTRSLDLQAHTLALALGLASDLGHSDATTRGISTDLDLQRFAAVIEPRYAPVAGVFVGARLAPGVQRVAVSLHDPSAPSTLSAAFWGLSVDASLSAGVRVNPATARAGLWLLAEGGYGWSPSHELTLTPRLAGRDADKAGTTSLGTLATAAPFFRISAALSY
jgi:hypothetical protein